jgi:hypothetical protein
MSAEGRTPRTWTQERLEATGGPAWSAGAALGLVLAGRFIAVEIATERLALAASVAMRPGLAQDVRIAVITLLAVANVPIACVYAVRLAREALCNYRP